MVSYSRRNKRIRAIRAASVAARLSRHSPAILTGVAGLLLLISIVNPDMGKETRMATTDAMAPVLSVIGAPFRMVSDGFGEVTGLTRIRAENARLQAENTQLKEWYQTAMLLRAENQSLKDLLNVLPEPEQSYITTRVIGDSGSSYIRTLLVEAGSEDGVHEGQAVMGDQGMIGRVIEVGRKAARVLLLSDINSHVPVVIEGVNQRAILAGTNNNELVLLHLPPDTLVTKSARIVTSGTGGQFPAGLPIGEVTSVIDGTIKVKLFSEPDNSGYVQVVEKPIDQDVRQSLESLKQQKTGN
ncbi:MAG TPA: rod shape-determining protein MreC [Alphaproteobacteria bacterium]|nr:rod shape-determining protein MreC [Alphaproteobacteria bacterium]HNS44024.1 rod shape-determining protein MreC [Alphaproteobacteria bacterium]